MKMKMAYGLSKYTNAASKRLCSPTIIARMTAIVMIETLHYPSLSISCPIRLRFLSLGRLL